MPGGLYAPPEVMLSWPTPNFVNPELRPNTLLYLGCVLGPITVIMLCVRLWVRIVHQRNPGWDDWLMVAATIPTTALTVLYALAGNNGLRQHIWDFDPFKDSKKLVNSRKYVLAIECIFCVASGLMKVSILLFYRRLSSRVVSKAFRWTTWITIGYIVVYTIVLTLVPILGCQPVSAFWDQVDIFMRLQGYEFHCFDEGADLFAASIISVSQDLLTAMLPTFLYWNLQISKRQKFGLFAIFALGYGVVALGGLRAYFSWRSFYETYDITWSTHDVCITSLLEIHVGAFCANAPTLKGFFKHFFKDNDTSTSKSKSHDRKNSTSSSMFSRVATLLGSSRSKNGYISEADTSVSVDAQGSIQVQRDIDAIRFPASALKLDKKHESVNTIKMMNAHYYGDMELGLCVPSPTSLYSSARSTKEFEGFDFSALPPLPASATSARSMDFPMPVTRIESQASQTTVTQELQEYSSRLAALEAQKSDSRPPTPTPFMKAQNPTRPSWQSWS